MRVPLLALALALGLALPAGADHPQQAGSHTASFDHKTGNEWWVEVIVTGSPTKVEARDDGGAWVALEKKSWGAWAKSFHIEPGHRVQFRASWSDGASLESCWFTHPAGVEQCAGTPPPPPPPSGDFTFTHGGGNEWWVEVKVSPMPGKVEAMDTGGNWVPLSFRSWGEWANSFHIEPGNQVRFRAFANEQWHESCWFTHPAGVPQCGSAPPPPPARTLVTFQHGGGNEWWVEAKVTPKPAQVHVMDTDGAWAPLTFKDWGEWAASYHVEEHHQVRFRATFADGSTAMSCWFVHPQGNVYGGSDRTCRSNTTSPPTPAGVQWPREGSYVKYYVDEGDSWPTGADWYELNVTLRYINGSWQEDVEGWNYFYLESDPDVEEQTRIRYSAASEGPYSLDPPPYASDNATTYVTKKNGSYVDVPVVYWNNEDPECPCGYDSWSVHEGTGLVIDYFFGGRMGHSSVEIVDTDAPIAPRDGVPADPPAPAWPTEGSFASYEVHEWYNGSSSPSETHLDITYTFEDGGWLVACAGTRTEWDVNGTNPTTTPVFETNGWSELPEGPLAIGVGSPVQVGHPTYCGTSGPYPEADTLVAKQTLSLNVGKDGAPFRARAWYADETDADQDAGLDYDRWWDVRTGLTLQWETRYDWPWTSIGTLTDTDAPLAAG